MIHPARYQLIEEWFKYLFTDQPFDSALQELAEWGRYLDPIDREEVRLRALPHLRLALGADAPSAERFLDAALELGVAMPEDALFVA